MGRRSHTARWGTETSSIELTKIGVAEAHIRTAVRLFFEGENPAPVYALANAAREIVSTIGNQVVRSVGMNVVLAMAGGPVRATRLVLTPLHVGASIRINDSLREGSSRFYAEIKRLRSIFDFAASAAAVSAGRIASRHEFEDRRIGAEGVVHALLKRGAIGLISTHDLSLDRNRQLAGRAICTTSICRTNREWNDEIRLHLAGRHGDQE